MNVIIFLLSLFGLQTVCLLFVSRFSKKNNDKKDYFLAGKNLGFFSLMMTCLATQVGGGLVLGAAEEAYYYGWTLLLYPMGAAIGLIVLGLGCGQRLASFQVSTVAQIFEVAYQSKNLKKIASILSIGSLFMILIAQFIASSKFMVSLGIDSRYLFVGFWAIVILYTSIGGLRAVISTDIIQALFFVGVFFLCFIWAILTTHFSFNDFLEGGLSNELSSLPHSKLIGWLIMPLLFMLIEQDMAQRCFAAVSLKTISKATFCAGLCVLAVCAIPIFFGVYAQLNQVLIHPGGSVLMSAVQAATNPTLTALLGCATLVATISTSASLINAISSHLLQDFDFQWKKQNEMKAVQIITAAIAITGIFFSFYFKNIVDILIQSYELSLSCLFIPIFIALFKKKCHTVSAVLAMAFGVSGFLLSRFISIDIFKEMFSLLLSFGGYLAGELIILLRMRWVHIGFGQSESARD